VGCQQTSYTGTYSPVHLPGPVGTAHTVGWLQKEKKIFVGIYQFCLFEYNYNQGPSALSLALQWSGNTLFD
jgi:hypothetical protein